MAVLYSDTFGGLGAADIAQQDAATRNQAQQLAFLVNLANQRNLAEQTASKERLGNRGYQSEDLRTTTGADTSRYATDARAEEAKNQYILNTVLAQNAANRGATADQIAFQTAAETARHNMATEAQGAALPGQQIDLEKLRLEAARQMAIAGGNQRLAEDNLKYGGPMGQLKMLQDQADTAKEQQVADTINTTVDQNHHWAINPFTDSDAAKKTALQKLINDNNLGDRLAIIVGENGTPKAVSRKLMGILPTTTGQLGGSDVGLNAQGNDAANPGAGPQANPAPSPTLLNAPVQPAAAGNPTLNALRRLFSLPPNGLQTNVVPGRPVVPVAAVAPTPIPRAADGSYLIYDTKGVLRSTPSLAEALAYLKTGFTITRPQLQPSVQDIPQNQ